MSLDVHLRAYHDIEYTQLRVSGNLSRATLLEAVPRGRLIVHVVINNVAARELAKFNRYQLPLQPATLNLYPLKDGDGNSCQVIALNHKMGLLADDTLLIGHIPDPAMKEVI